MPETEHREALDPAAIRRRFDRFRRYEDAAGGPLTGEEHVSAIAAAWDVEPLLAEVDRLRRPAPEHADGLDHDGPDWCGYMTNQAACALIEAGEVTLAEHVEALERWHRAHPGCSGGGDDG